MDIERSSNFKRKYKKKTAQEQDDVDEAIRLLAQNPHHPGLHTSKVQGTKDIFECYINGSHRITFQYGDDCIVLRNNCTHEAVYRHP